MADNLAEETAEELDTDETIEKSDVIEELDDEGNPIKKEVPLFMQEDEQTSSDSTMPVASHVKVKHKLKGQIKDEQNENTKLREEIDALKRSQSQAQEVIVPKRPKSEDFDTDEEYEAKLDEYHQQLAQSNYSTFENTRKEEEKQVQVQQAVEEAVTEHYSRVDKLIADHAISPEVYKKADASVRRSVDTVMPDLGDKVVDYLISTLGEGSEKTVLYLGRNKPQLDAFQALLLEDPLGIKAAVFLGRISEQINGTQTKTSRAPKPAAQIDGDEQITAKAGSHKKMYDKAKTPQAKYNAKKTAKAAGVDTKNW